MKIIIAKDCNINGKRYTKGKEFKYSKDDIPLINKMNEDGFIKPLTKSQLLELSNSFNTQKNKEE